MWKSAGMKSDLSFLNIVSTHKITIYIIQYFITVDVAMVIRCRNRFRMVIV